MDLNMKKILLSSAALLGLVASASAADLPRRSAPVVYAPAPIPVFTWTGFYAGINAGYAFSDTDSRDRTLAIPGGSVFTPAGVPLATNGTLSFTDRDRNRDGFAGGGQVGYNYQFTPGSGIVVGVEADIQYIDFNGNRNDFRSYSFVPGGATTPGLTAGLVGRTVGVIDTRNSLDYFGTVRGRLGYAFDRTLVYATGGFAYGDGDNNYRGTFFTNSRDTFRTGYAVGGGVEFALAQDSFFNFFGSSAVTAKIEGLYVNLERERYGQASTYVPGAIPGVAGSTGTLFLNTARREEDFAVVRAGLNYKFGTY